MPAPDPLVRYVSTPAPSESSILPKFLEKSDPEVARPAFSTWSLQNSRPKAFEVCASIQIHQSAYGDRWKNLCEAGLGFWADNGRDTLIGGSGSTNRGNSRDYCWSKEQTKERFGTRHNISWLEHMNMFVENTIVTIKKMKKILFNRCTWTPSSCLTTSLFSARN